MVKKEPLPITSKKSHSTEEEETSVTCKTKNNVKPIGREKAPSTKINHVMVKKVTLQITSNKISVTREKETSIASRGENYKKPSGREKAPSTKINLICWAFLS